MDIDKEITALEPGVMAGTVICRALVGLDILREHGIKITKEEAQTRECLNVWSLGVGRLDQAKSFFYGRTIAEAVRKAKKAAKEGGGLLVGAWGTQIRVRSGSRAKKL